VHYTHFEAKNGPKINIKYNKSGKFPYRGNQLRLDQQLFREGGIIKGHVGDNLELIAKNPLPSGTQVLLLTEEFFAQLQKGETTLAKLSLQQFPLL